MLVEVDWTVLHERHPLWQDSLCLYAYLHPKRDWLLYVGKADLSTVRERFGGRHKLNLFDDIAREYDIEGIRTLHGALVMDPGRNRTSHVLADIESLLIMRLQPYGNIQAKRSRTSRPGMRVHCVGDWPLKRFRFHDDV